MSEGVYGKTVTSVGVLGWIALAVLALVVGLKFPNTIKWILVLIATYVILKNAPTYVNMLS